MRRLVNTLAGALLAISVVVMCTGCEGGFVQDAARNSFVDFVTSVFDTAVNSAIGG